MFSTQGRSPAQRDYTGAAKPPGRCWTGSQPQPSRLPPASLGSTSPTAMGQVSAKPYTGLFPPRWRASPKGLRAAEEPCPSSPAWRQLQGIFPPAKNRRGREKADAPWAFSASFSPLTPLTPPALPPQRPLSDPSVVMQPPGGGLSHKGCSPGFGYLARQKAPACVMWHYAEPYGVFSTAS